MSTTTNQPLLESLQREYSWVLDVFKMDLDIHYRRLQMMLALESVLIVGFAFKDWSTSHTLIPVYAVCSLGIVLSLSWRFTSISQWQFLELRRRMLRELEARMGCAVKILTIDKQVFYTKGDPYIFQMTEEKFPDEKGRFRRRWLRPSSTRIEISVSTVFLAVWVGLSIWAIVCLGHQASAGSNFNDYLCL